jgi:mercuric ion binding protein
VRGMIRMLTMAAALFVAAGPARAAERVVTLDVDNVTCTLCGPIVKRALGRVPGVRRVDISEEGGRATARVTFDDSRTTVAALIEATTNAGYPSRVAP